ncbi:guanylate kinase [Singulisphaera acidiphila]|uniref:Guanylate kinase n=1 Tax=Singulisphaera acidiphila (strain ATCC BAA-1392 / DSM 18658 / VKM B-2454 / MOB10) TaxID=886293 RepID=L0D9H6_SINAD|nr:guanylate kinase [Singulisphaera acidiphila]AGA25872.1 guanylate kinase [Singulisphaera acidiphila DSM 18658]
MDDWEKLPGRLIVISGASGSGKSTLVRLALRRPEVKTRLSISATTRAPRPGEEEGREYFFFSRQAFEEQRERGQFLESAEVHGNLYGTPAGPVRERLARGECVLLEIDVQGALLVKEKVPAALLIFINVPSFAILESRLRDRATDSDETIARRLANARWELDQVHRYDFQLMNSELDQAVNDLVALLVQHGCGG